MTIKPVVVDSPLDKAAFLRQLGLEEDLLRDVARVGLSGRTACTGNHPPTYAGTRQWGEMVKALRDRLIPVGWKKSDRKNFCMTIRGDDQIALVVARGDGFTGSPSPDVMPMTKYPKGVITRAVVDLNDWLPFDQEFIARNRQEIGPKRDQEDQAPSIWVLLHSIIDGRLELELSHPVGMNSSGYVDRWDIRIPLTPTDLDPDKMPVLDDEPVDPVVNVTRRKNSA